MRERLIEREREIKTEKVRKRERESIKGERESQRVKKRRGGNFEERVNTTSSQRCVCTDQ